MNASQGVVQPWNIQQTAAHISPALSQTPIQG